MFDLRRHTRAQDVLRTTDEHTDLKSHIMRAPQARANRRRHAFSAQPTAGRQVGALGSASTREQQHRRCRLPGSRKVMTSLVCALKAGFCRSDRAARCTAQAEPPLGHVRPSGGAGRGSSGRAPAWRSFQQKKRREKRGFHSQQPLRLLGLDQKARALPSNI